MYVCMNLFEWSPYIECKINEIWSSWDKITVSIAGEHVQWHLTQVACHGGITCKHFTIHPDCLVVSPMMGADPVAADCLVSTD